MSFSQSSEDPNQNQSPQAGYDSQGQLAPTEKPGALESFINGVFQSHQKLFKWLLSCFSIGSQHPPDQLKALEEALKNPEKLEKLLNTFYQLQHQYEQLKSENTQLSNQIHNLNRYKQQYESLNRQHTTTNYQLQQQIQSLTNSNAYLKQENQRLEKEKEKLRRENQEISTRFSSLLGHLGQRDRDKSRTITSEESRRQRDVLTQEFVSLNTQEFTAASNEIFNHQCADHPDFKAKRRQEVAYIKSILSQQIFKSGMTVFANYSEPFREEDFLEATQMLMKNILTDLGIPSEASFPEKIRRNLENLVEKGLRLVKDIANDEPPGDLFIENEGTSFNSEIHQPVPGCGPRGKILYTVYPGYRVNNRLLGDAVKAFVYTVPEEEFQSTKTVSDEQEQQIVEENSPVNKTNSSENESTCESNPPGETISDADQGSVAVDGMTSSETTGNSQHETEGAEVGDSLVNELSAAEKVKVLKQLGMSDEDIAKESGVKCVKTVQGWETGTRPISDNAKKLDELYQKCCRGDRSEENNNVESP